MFLAIDIGNTNITIGLCKENRLVKRLWLPTKSNSQHSLSLSISKAARPLGIKSLDGAIICSVVPSVSRQLETVIKKRFKIRPILVGRDIEVPIKNSYRVPSQVGQDRLVNAYACLKHHGKPAIIVDFGTAITFDYLDKKGGYAGGLITPGIEISLDALARRTALLPKIRLKKPQLLIGKDTQDSIRSGLFYGISCQCDGVVAKIKKHYSHSTKVVATGGASSFFKQYCKCIDKVDADLTLKGLQALYSACFEHK